MKRIVLLTIGPLLALSAPAMAAPAPTTRLVECGAQNCLLVSGRRDDASAPVSINGHEVAVQGKRSWRARVPVATIRAWSALHAQTVSVTVSGVDRDVRLPVGMLGPRRDLAMLEVRVK